MITLHSLPPAQNAPHSASPRPGLAARLLTEGERLLAAQRPAEALPLLQSAAEALADGRAWLLLGEASLQLNNPVAAAEAAAAARAVEGATPAVLVLAGRALLSMGRPEEALAEAAEAVMIDRHGHDVRLLLGQTLKACDRHDEALAVLGELWQEAPGDSGATLRLADALMHAGSHDAAAELLAHMLDNAALAGHARSQALLLRAQNALRRGNLEAALAAALAGLEETGADAALHTTAAHALLAMRRMGDAKPHLLIAHRLAPDDGYLAHLAASVGAFLPERADAQYVSRVFDGYAPGFEAALLGLGYRAPGLILRQFEALLPGLGAEYKLRNLLDLGCGTGLIGLVLHDVVAGSIKGVDLSAGMLAAAQAKGIYTELRQAEINAALLADQEQWHAIVAADVFIYFGTLEATLAAIGRRLAPDGWFVFTTEALDGPQAWELGETGRFRHSEAGLLQALATAGLEPVVLRREALRREGPAILDGFLVVAKRAL